MTEAFTALDWVIVFATVASTVIGLFLGFAGQIATIAGLGAAVAAGYFLFGVALECAVLMGFSAGGATIPGAVVDLVFALLAFGIVRLAVKRFVSECLGALANALLGALVGFGTACAGVGFLAGIGTSAPNTHGQSPFAEKSVIVQRVAGWADGKTPQRPAGPADEVSW